MLHDASSVKACSRLGALWLTAWPLSEHRTREAERGDRACGDPGAELPLRARVLAGGLYERSSGAAGRPVAGYRRRTPERTVLHELVAQHAQTMLAELRDADPDGGGLPRYVERELAAYLKCGVLTHGFARVRC